MVSSELFSIIFKALLQNFNSSSFMKFPYKICATSLVFPPPIPCYSPFTQCLRVLSCSVDLFFLPGFSERKDSARVISNDNASDSEDEAGSRDQNSTDNCRNCLNWTTHYPENFCQLIGANGEDMYVVN